MFLMNCLSCFPTWKIAHHDILYISLLTYSVHSIILIAYFCLYFIIISVQTPLPISVAGSSYSESRRLVSHHVLRITLILHLDRLLLYFQTSSKLRPVSVVHPCSRGFQIYAFDLSNLCCRFVLNFLSYASKLLGYYYSTPAFNFP